ncbi:MAG TPA: ABC transporter ATP-binding protein, partial [Pusillimonas sp.]|nr:ABC transporter ATP-binding protein [Pusillimonas sp.]
MSRILEVSDLHVSYGPIKALRGVSLSVSEGETVSIVGANGAGKSTLMRALSGILP